VGGYLGAPTGAVRIDDAMLSRKALLKRKLACAWRLLWNGSSSEVAGQAQMQACHRAACSTGVALRQAFAAPGSGSSMVGLALAETPHWERVGRRAQVWPAP